jgi:hypothetical protein
MVLILHINAYFDPFGHILSNMIYVKSAYFGYFFYIQFTLQLNRPLILELNLFRVKLIPTKDNKFDHCHRYVSRGLSLLCLQEDNKFVLVPTDFELSCGGCVFR